MSPPTIIAMLLSCATYSSPISFCPEARSHRECVIRVWQAQVYPGLSAIIVGFEQGVYHNVLVAATT
jgi:hypothetical protein